MKLTKETLQFIYTHAMQAYPDECCGIITGKADQQNAHACQNIQDILHQQDPMRYPRTARIAYTIDPKEADRVISQALQDNQDVLVFYHSHPDHDAYFSEEDVEAQTVFGEPQWPQTLQVVVSVRLGLVSGLKCYMWDSVAQDFKEKDSGTD
ncbi:MAG: M67 family metallopeptidase [Nitrospirae bacterium]|nr:M67 family metallopeptidase [Nitrospirota bacterium]MBF0592285.1 M67 family metallopeptidase [Nitrospirota bacterium]